MDPGSVRPHRLPDEPTGLGVDDRDLAVVGRPRRRACRRASRRPSSRCSGRASRPSRPRRPRGPPAPTGPTARSRSPCVRVRRPARRRCGCPGRARHSTRWLPGRPVGDRLESRPVEQGEGAGELGDDARGAVGAVVDLGHAVVGGVGAGPHPPRPAVPDVEGAADGSHELRTWGVPAATSEVVPTLRLPAMDAPGARANPG